MKASARNKLLGAVKRITRGDTIANVEIDVSGERMVSSITTEAVNELGLEVGTEVVVLIKSSDVMLATIADEQREDIAQPSRPR